MIGLGLWQLQRAEWKERLIADLEAAGPQRKASISCTLSGKPEVRAGRSEGGESGYRYLMRCASGERVDLGWSKRPDLLPQVQLTGTLAGTYTNAAEPILILSEPLPPLQKSAIPSPADLPNNHMLYAVEWFFFALAAVVIYLLALGRRRLT